MSWTTGNISAVTHRSELCFHWIFTGTDMDYATQVIHDAKHPLGQSVRWYISIRRQGCATFPSGIEPFQLVRSFNLHSLMLLFAFQMPGAPTRPLPPLSADRPRISPSPRLNPPVSHHTHTYILIGPSISSPTSTESRDFGENEKSLTGKLASNRTSLQFNRISTQFDSESGSMGWKMEIWGERESLIESALCGPVLNIRLSMKMSSCLLNI